MSIKETTQASKAKQGRLQVWLPLISPALKERLAQEEVAFPPSKPTLARWLALLQAAEITPLQIDFYLAQLLHSPASGGEQRQAWVTLTRLFALTFEAAQSVSAQLDAQVWPILLEVQNRILTTAAATALARPDRPSTGSLTRRALYLPLVTELNQKIFAAWDAPRLLDEVVALIQQKFDYEYVAIFLLDQSTKMLTLQSAAWSERQPAPLDLPPLSLTDKNIIARAAATNQVLTINNISQTSPPAPRPLPPPIQAQAAVPLAVENEVLGVLEAAGHRPDTFLEDDCQILKALADHTAVAVKNLYLQSALKRHLHDQKVLYDSSVALGTTLDAAAVLKQIIQKIVEAVEAEACVICKIDHKAGTTTALAEYVSASADYPLQTWRQVDRPVPLAEDSLSQQVLRTQQPVMGQVSAHHHHRRQTGEGRAQDQRGTILVLPFALKKQVIGLIEIYDHRPDRNFSGEDIELCQVLATQAALALERARLFEETRHRLNQITTLYTMTHRVADNLDLQEVVESIVTTLRQIIACRGCCIFLLDQDQQILEIKAAAGLKAHWEERAKLRVGEGVAGLAVAREETIYLPDTRHDPDFIFFDPAVRSLLATPLTANGKIIGAINVDDDRPYAFGPAQENLLKIAATQVGIAIENARLFAKISTEQQQNQAIIRHMADGLLVIDRQGVIVACNPALSKMLNFSCSRVVGRPIDAPDLHPHLARISAAMTGQTRAGVLTNEVSLAASPPKTLQIFVTPMVDDEQQPVGEVRIIRDVTQERELEQMKDEFMSTISHELRTPLFSIQGFAQIMLEDENELTAEKRREFVTIIRDQAAQLGEMVTHLLDLTKLEAGKDEFEREPVSLLDLLRQAGLKLQGLARQQNVDLISQLPDSLPLITGDAMRLEQVVTNLLGNAIKFTAAGGQVRLTAGVADQEIVIAVEDNGIGIPPEALQEIFSRYYRVKDKDKEAAQGAGLGLHIAHRIVESHGGRIWAESVAGQGSTFRFSLPLPETTAAA